MDAGRLSRRRRILRDLGLPDCQASCRNATFGVIFDLVILGFAYAVYTVGSDLEAVFYLPLPRACEFGVGAALAFTP